MSSEHHGREGYLLPSFLFLTPSLAPLALPHRPIPISETSRTCSDARYRTILRGRSPAPPWRRWPHQDPQHLRRRRQAGWGQRGNRTVAGLRNRKMVWVYLGPQGTRGRARSRWPGYSVGFFRRVKCVRRVRSRSCVCVSFLCAYLWSAMC